MCREMFHILLFWEEMFQVALGLAQDVTLKERSSIYVQGPM